MKTYKQDGFEIIVKNNPKTPRACISCYFSIDNAAKYAGVNSLIARLLVRGTNKRTAEELTLELQNNGIELSSEARQDYLKAETVFLNQDFDLAKEILHDVLENSTFLETSKEIFKLKGEITANLDSSVAKVSDKFTRTLFEGHPYGNTVTKTLEEADFITADILKDFYKIILKSKKVLVAVGSFEDEEKVLNILKNEFLFLQNHEPKGDIKDFKVIEEDKTVKIIKNSANQAHILQGWLVGTADSEDYAKLVVMNNLLGSSGLSSRLFYELRDKQGLAYTVRSSYEVLRHAGILSFYIGTSPKNINKSLDGFKTEIIKLRDNLPTEEELQGAKENVLGRLAYFSQTNEQQANMMARDLIFNRGTDYREKYVQMINSVTRKDLSDMAGKYLTGKSLIAVIAPEEYLDF